MFNEDEVGRGDDAAGGARVVERYCFGLSGCRTRSTANVAAERGRRETVAVEEEEGVMEAAVESGCACQPTAHSLDW